MTVREELMEIYRAYDADPRFKHLRSTHGLKRLVPGRGSFTPRVIMVGEAPGEKEAIHRKPFKGPAGEVLDHLLGVMGVSRNDVWLTNVVKYRPTIGEITVRNRTPNTAEQIASWPYLFDEVNIFPRDIPLVTLGGVALVAFHYDPNAKVSTWHGRSFTGHNGRLCVSWFHPAYAVYDSSNLPVMETDAREFAEQYLKG